jgi:hypothetical protein
MNGAPRAKASSALKRKTPSPLLTFPQRHNSLLFYAFLYYKKGYPKNVFLFFLFFFTSAFYHFYFISNMRPISVPYVSMNELNQMRWCFFPFELTRYSRFLSSILFESWPSLVFSLAQLFPLSSVKSSLASSNTKIKHGENNK